MTTKRKAPAGATAGDTPAGRDRNHPANGSGFWTGQVCVEDGCVGPAGTAWSRLWCFDCNVERMDRITKSLERLSSQDREITA